MRAALLLYVLGTLFAALLISAKAECVTDTECRSSGPIPAYHTARRG